MLRISRLLSLFLVGLLTLAFAITPRQSRAAAQIIDPALTQQLQTAAPGLPLSVIVTFDAQPTLTQLTDLLNLGASIAPLRRLPMVGVLATPAQIELIKQLSGVRSVYANQRLQYFLRESVNTIGAASVWADYGYQGEGVGVAVVDTGIDGLNPDLQYGSKTVQNTKVIGLQYAAGVDLDMLNLPVWYLENLPNTDTSGGHGTHVAGIIGASGAASSQYYRGVAPRSNLIGLGAGEAIEIFTALASFDWIIAHKQQYNIRVVNCSWGNIIPGFDPNNPVNVATKALHDAGIAVVFASGNSGSNTDTLNTYSVAPWVIGVAAGDKDGRNVSFFSSRGIPGSDFYHPTLTAPGYLIASDRAVTGVATNVPNLATDPLYLQPQYLPYYTVANGTSMAAPHVSGTIALMVQANPNLTPDVIKRVLINTATPLPDYQEYAAGAGYLNARKAVETAKQIKNVRKYRDPRTGEEHQVYDQTSTWTGNVGVSLPGLAASDTRTITVAPGTLSLDVAVDWSTIASDLNLYLYNPQGALVAKSEVIQSVYNYANETVHVNNPVAGTWTVKVSGFLNIPQDYRATSNGVVLVNP
ncbi:MAG TPA: S8 family serine peptidase [Herpetosiphonaceae bacterium]